MLADVNLMIFENLMGRTIPLSACEAHEFDALAEQHIPDAAQRALAHEVAAFLNATGNRLPNESHAIGRPAAKLGAAGPAPSVSRMNNPGN